ncbi:MAG: DUF1552 domain-containing protein [Planctomycetes bacterium]|nr:DUF1552 domain-containing protein [Planctomycetota bacterium]
MSKKWHIPRRTFLRGAGVTMALPMLNAMLPVSRALANPAADSATTADGYPIRYAALFMPNGVDPRSWAPTGKGANFELSPILLPLSVHKPNLLVLSHLEHDRVKWGDGHYVKSAAWLTGTAITKTTGADVRSNGISVDQLAAQHIGNLTRLPSLELSLESPVSSVDTNVGFTQLYGGFISWSTPSTPVAREINPKLAFDRLFRSAGGQKSALNGDDRSVLDLVMDDAKGLRQQLGAEDQRKLDEYFDSVRSVEHRIEFEADRRSKEHADDAAVRDAIAALGKRVDAWDSDVEHKSERSFDHTEHAKLMLDLMVLAFWTDSTRIATLMFGRDVSPKNFSFLPGVEGGHHQTSHHENNPGKMDQYRAINIWHTQQFAYMLDKMAAIREGDRSLLDNSTLMFGSSLRDGNAHSPVDLPIVLAGRAGGQLSPGRHIVYPDSTALTDLYLANLQHLGVPIKSFSDSDEVLPGLNDANYAGV